MNDRYSRQIMLPEIGPQGQERIAQSSVLIVGAGGLGSPSALYLAAAGVGRIGLIDDDVVSESNLQRQILYTTDEVGESKVACAARRLKSLSPHTHIDTYPTRLTADNAASIITRYDMVIDGCDNATTRYLIDDVCAELDKPYLYAAISHYEGQLTIFNARKEWRYCHLYPDRELALSQPTIAQGVIGPLPGVIGTLQASECIKYIVGMENALLRRLFTINLLTMQSNIFEL